MVSFCIFIGLEILDNMVLYVLIDSYTNVL
jgi:hypothetical protein